MQLYPTYRNKHREAATLRRQTNMVQIKEQNKTPEELNKMEMSNQSDAQFKTLVIRMLQKLTGYFNNIKKTQAEMKIALSKGKIYKEPTVKGIKPRIKSTIWKTRKEKAFNQNGRKKKNSKRQGQA